MGLSEIQAEATASDGTIEKKNDDVFDTKKILHARYGVHLAGTGFVGAGKGGLTRAVTPPLSFGLLIKEVSIALRTTGNESTLYSRIFVDDVAHHAVIGLSSKSDSTPTISDQIGKPCGIIAEDKGKSSIYGRVSDEYLPLVVHATNKYDIL